MEAKPRLLSQGQCVFCEAEVDKSKMTQHLKACKPRLAAIEQEQQSKQPKVRWLHILAEGRYAPQYWLHFEVPDNEPLWVLDRFLKDMWIDDLEHLSGFTINGTDYRDQYSGRSFTVVTSRDNIPVTPTNKVKRKVSEKAAEIDPQKIIDEIMTSYVKKLKEDAKNTPEMYRIPVPTEWIAEIKKPRSVHDLIVFLKKERVRLAAEEKANYKASSVAMTREAQLENHKRSSSLPRMAHIVERLLEAVEDTSMSVSLESVLKVGQKFSYIYDFGSSTYITLKVIAAREGIINEDDDALPVLLLSQNSEPTFPCSTCGKPATTISMDEDLVLCDSCLAKGEYDEWRLLPIINSPRVGVI